MNFHHDDTIVALSTPPGIGAIGVIRLSGGSALAIADKSFKGKKLLDQPTHTLHFGRIEVDGKLLDEVVASIFKHPTSYTGEDVVEISCHGSPYILQQLLDVYINAGARMAQPGEFTQRAFLNGRLDLTQAEAVADLIASQNSSAQQAAMHNLRGGFSQQLKEMREELIKFSALIELELDFSQEDVAFADRKALYALVDHSMMQTEKLIASFQLGNVVKNGISVAIIGKPNAGKSTLLNALLNEERSIVSDIAGTTRDTVEEIMNIEGILFRFIDTAGIRQHTADVIEKIGIERSYRNAENAGLVLLLLDITDNNPEEQEIYSWLVAHDKKFLPVYTKMDLLPGNDAAQHPYLPGSLFINAKEKQGIEALKKKLYELATGNQLNSENTIITNTRHHAALQQVLKSLEDIKAGMDNNLPGDLLAMDIRHCLHNIGELTGEVTTEDKLDWIFSKFCIGK